jgi:diaminopimelate epimerase
MRLTFYKYHGTGNDFILIDNRQARLNLEGSTIARLCDRKYGVGADGLMLLQLRDDYDFEMVYYNADGAFPSMCGNGARCIVEFARHLGVVGVPDDTTSPIEANGDLDSAAPSQTVRFLALDGLHEALIVRPGLINLRLADVSDVTQGEETQGGGLGFHFLNTGVPHMVRFVSNLDSYDVAVEGKRIRYNTTDFGLPGTNANFVERDPESSLNRVRTYERGVEAETLSCGTGVTACAIVCSIIDQPHVSSGDTTEYEYEINTLGGMLKVKFRKASDTSFTNVWLEGPATFVFKGEIEI